MSWLLKQILGTKEDRASASSAKNRLVMTLRHDRGNLPPGLLEELRDEIIAVIAKKLKVEEQDVVVNLSGAFEHQRLVAEVPLPSPTRRRRA